MKKLLFLVIIIALFFAVLLTGCAIGGTARAQAETASDTGKTMHGQPVINMEDNKENQKLISDYFLKMYSAAVEDYQKNSESGNIPDNLSAFVTKRTIEEGNNNTEIGLNFPRFIGLNGTTLISYSILMKSEDSKQPDIDSTFIEENDGTLLYFVKINLKGQCVPDEVFDASYKLNSDRNTYCKVTQPNGSIIDEIRIQAKYDVELVKEDKKYKILRAREVAFKQGSKNRLFKYNNDFITRLPYLNLDKTTDNTAYLNKEDGAVFDKEKAVIVSIFDNLLKLDNERRILLGGCWEKDLAGFKGLMESIGLNKDKDKKEILEIDNSYKDKLPKKALLLQNDIYKIRVSGEFKDICSVKLHPAYTSKNKWYIVTFKASMEKDDGISGNGQEYSFDYLIKLSRDTKTPKVERIKLNAAMQLPDQTESKQ